MKLCDPNHPEHYYWLDGKRVGWGGNFGDMPYKFPCPFFNEIEIHTKLIRLQDGYFGVNVKATVFGECHTLFEICKPCCKRHFRDALIIKVATQPWAYITHPYPGGVRLPNGKWKDPMSRAFLLARKISKKSLTTSQ